MKINNKNWIEFDFKDIFWFKRGKRLITQNQIDGDIAYISSTKTNNGIDNYITPPDYMTIYENAMTLNNSGSIGYCFYHTYKFVASDHCTILKIKDKKTELNLHLFLFLKPIIEKMKSKYGFAREMSNERLNKEKILLPAKKKDNKYIPDWEYMEKYINEHAKDITYNKKILNPKRVRNLKKNYWQEIIIDDLFIIKKGERLVESERKNGVISTPLITASSINNGVTSFIDYDLFKDKKKVNENKITIDMFCNVFYQDFKYFSDDNVHTLYFKNKKYEKYYNNKYINLFLVTSLKQLFSKYGYGRQVRLKRLQYETIKLPYLNGEPDFDFMENYIKSLPYSVEIKKNI